MGTSVCFVAAKGPRSRKSPKSWDELAVVPGWSIYGPRDRWVYPRILEEAAVRLANAHQNVAIAAFVEDSDIGFLAPATENGVVARLLFGAEWAGDYAEGAEALALIRADRRSQPESFEYWSDLAGSRISAEQIRGLLRKHWVFKEDPVKEVFRGLGIELPWQSL